MHTGTDFYTIGPVTEEIKIYTNATISKKQQSPCTIPTKDSWEYRL